MSHLASQHLARRLLGWRAVTGRAVASALAAHAPTRSDWLVHSPARTPPIPASGRAERGVALLRLLVDSRWCAAGSEWEPQSSVAGSGAHIPWPLPAQSHSR